MKSILIGRFSRVESLDPPDEADEEGWRRVSICFQFEEDACECLLGFGDRIEVLEPWELRTKLVDRARSVVEFYSRS